MKVTFDNAYSAFQVIAPKGTMISYTATPTAIADGVYVIGDEGSICIDDQLTDTLYLSTVGSDYTVTDGSRVIYPLGDTSVIIRGNISTVPFKSGTKGGGSGGGCNYKGTTTTAIENGSTTNPITIDGESYTAVFGDIVVYGYTEFVFDGTTWSEFGRPFDTTPTSGSGNAVTSDGIYKYVYNNSSNWKRGAGYQSAVLGEGSPTASGRDSISVGSYTSSTANYGVSMGNHTVASKTYMLSIGAYNSPREGDLFNIGNGIQNARSNILEVNSTSMNVNGTIQRDGVGIDDYTITERKIGKWIDGSDLYQRTFEISDLEKNTWHYSLLGTTGIDIVDFQGFVEWYKASDDTLAEKQALNYFDSTDERNETLVDSTGEDLCARFTYVGSTKKSNCKVVITIKYTKPSAPQANLMQTAPTEEVSETPTEDDMR